MLIGTGMQKLLASTSGSVPPYLWSFSPVSPVQVAQTADGVDADLWKDGLFKSKVTRYLCFTRSFSKENVSPVALYHWPNERKPFTFLLEISSFFCLFACLLWRWFIFTAILIYLWF